MSENNNREDFAEKFREFTKQSTETLISASKDIKETLLKEKNKAEIRSKIGHQTRDLEKLYAEIGQKYYEYKTLDKAIENEDELLVRIAEGTRNLDALNESLAQIETPSTEE